MAGFRDGLRAAAAERAREVREKIYPEVKDLVRASIAKSVSEGALYARMESERINVHELKPLIQADPDFSDLTVEVMSAVHVGSMVTVRWGPGFFDAE